MGARALQNLALKIYTYDAFNRSSEPMIGAGLVILKATDDLESQSRERHA